MKTIRKIGVIFLCAVMLLGFCTVSLTAACYALRMKGITSPIITWFTQNASVELYWLNTWSREPGKYERPRTSLEKYRDFTVGLKDTVESFCTTSFPGSRSVKAIVDAYKENVLHNDMTAEIGGKTDREYAEEAVAEIRFFSDYLASEGIDFLYVNLPAKERFPAYTDTGTLPSDVYDRSDLFSDLMESSGIPYLNFDRYTDLISTFSLDDTGHWVSADALAATKIIAERLNNLYDYRFDLSLFAPDHYDNILDQHPDLKREIQGSFGYDYALLVPAHSPIYRLDYSEHTVYEGDFTETLLEPVSNWDKRADDGSAIAYHNLWRIKNGAFVDIVNTSGTNNDGRKILVLGDSLSWPISSYLSLDVEELAAMHPRYFYGDVRTYIEYYKPDLVLWIYGEVQIGPDNDLVFGVVNP